MDSYYPIRRLFDNSPHWVLAYQAGGRGRKQQVQQREHTKALTKSTMISKAQYVGGHPLISQACSVVLGLSDTALSIYSIDNLKRLSLMSSISLLDIVQVGVGRPKTAKEIYDEDSGYTIDVYEQSPFLSVIFRLKEHSYAASFEGFEATTPQEWFNQIVTFQYELRGVQAS